MKAKSNNGTLAPISSWAVGRLADTSQIALKLNEFYRSKGAVFPLRARRPRPVPDYHQRHQESFYSDRVLRIRQMMDVMVQTIVALGLVLAILIVPIRSEPIAPGAVQVVDGQTVRARGQNVRLVGFDTPPVGINAHCEGERSVAAQAARRLQALVAGGELDLKIMPCSCSVGPQATLRCSSTQTCGVLKARGLDVGATLISEGLAKSYVCGAASCPPRPSWC
jgi:endonuclease YncB( thermonuclease family)